jgi:hypothetical protein
LTAAETTWNVKTSLRSSLIPCSPAPARRGRP